MIRPVCPTAETAALVAVCRRELERANDDRIGDQLSWIERRPTDPSRLYTLADLCREYGRLDLWYRAALTALTLPHYTHQQVFQRGQTKVMLGDWSGWTDREARLFNPDTDAWRLEYWRSTRWAHRAWDGAEVLHDHTLFILADGTDGECIQMLRYIPDVSARARTIILGVSAPLIPLVRQWYSNDRVTVTFRHIDHQLPFTRYTWLLSLPALCGTSPPLAPFANRGSRSRKERAEPYLTVGVWTGNQDEAERTPVIPPAIVALALDSDDIQWDRLGPPKSYLSAMALLMQFDCIVTVDGSVAHLAGSLGIPTFVLLSCGADPIWGLDETTPWYPSMRLIRQTRRGNWTSVVDTLKAELRVQRHRDSSGRS